MIGFLKRLLAVFFAPSLERLEREASEYGRITLHQAEIGMGLGWYCSIRPAAVRNGPHAHRYTWTGQGMRLEEALQEALKEARANPMTNITGAACVPRLGTEEFDRE